MWRLCCPNVIALCGEDDERDLYCCKSLQPAFKNAQEMRDLMLNTLTRRCDYCTVDYSTVGNQYLLGGASNAGADPGCLRGRGTTCMLGCVCVCVCVCVGGGSNSCERFIVKRGHFITFCPLEGHPRGHFIMFYPPWGHPRGHLHLQKHANMNTFWCKYCKTQWCL